MSVVSRALLRLASPGAVLAPVRAGEGFGVFPKGDRRCRPVARLARGDVRALSADGALQEIEPGVFALSEAGDARVRREAAERGEEFLAQHAPVVTRNVVDHDGDVREVRGLETHAVLRRLSALQDQNGAHWLTGAELDVAARLRFDWELSQVGLVRGSDWAAPPQSGRRARARQCGRERDDPARRCTQACGGGAGGVGPAAAACARACVLQ